MRYWKKGGKCGSRMEKTGKGGEIEMRRAKDWDKEKKNAGKQSLTERFDKRNRAQL